ncbi:MAG: PLP-dependent transferase [Tannerella sp.]|jgi:O-acetylhomoserine (thiol)-lyase|nr:PLP-dependent transferase [Tannerella sp.]
MKQSFETQLLNVPYDKQDAHLALSMPVYNAVAFECDTAEEMEQLFSGQAPGHYYSRVSNPTVAYYEERVQALTGAMSVTASNSGMSAISDTLMTIAYAGANIVSSNHLFGNTYSLMKNIFSHFDVELRTCDMTNLDEVRSQIDNRTCAVFLEIISNPQLEVVDLKSLSAVCNELNVPLIADSTVVPFCVFDAKALGVNIEVISSTKYISGGATSTGGLLIDYGTFDWSRSKALKTWHDKFGNKAFTMRMKKETGRCLGSYMTPQAAYMQTLGLETLKMRFERQSSTCLALAQRLQTLPAIASVNYPGLKDSTFYQISLAQFGQYPGAMLTIDLASRAACFDCLNRLKIIRRATNLFDNRSLAIHPASTIYVTFSLEQREKMHIREHTIRLSIGLESVDDLFEDIRQSLSR